MNLPGDPHEPSSRFVDRLYVVLTAVFLTSLLVADLTAGKFFSVAGLEVSVGVVPFPITFVLTDVVNEYYGVRGARRMTALGMAMLVFAFGLLSVARLLPVSEHSPVPGAAFEGVFGMSWRFFAASITAYLVGQLTDIYTFAWAKRLTESRHLWLRATGSTAVSQTVDTGVVTFAALAGTMPLGQIASVAALSYGYKMVVAVLLTPVCYLAHALLSARLGRATEGLVPRAEVVRTDR